MEGKKQGAKSSFSTSSIVEDLFGRKDKSSEILGSVFPALSQGMGRKHEADDKVWRDQNAYADGYRSKGSPSKPQSVHNKDRNADYQGGPMTPCHLTSSLYYGGQDVYNNYSSTQSSGNTESNYQYKKDGEDDPNNSNMASRGDWWQGSLYY